MAQHHRILGLGSFILGVLFSASAFAVGNGQVVTTGAGAKIATLEFRDPAGKVTTVTSKQEDSRCEDERKKTGAKDDGSNRCGLIWWLRDKDAGRYTVQVMSRGTPVGMPQPFTIIDNQTNLVTLDTDRGVITATNPNWPGTTRSSGDPLADRYEARLNAVILLGYQNANVDSTVNSTFFGSTPGDFNPGGFSGGFEFQAIPWAGTSSPVAPLFFAVNITGTSSTAQGPVIGIGGDFTTTQLKVRGGGQFLAGFGFPVGQQVVISPLVGVSALSVQGRSLSFEVPGGGNANTFSQNKIIFGPTLGLQVETPIAPRTRVFFRYTYAFFDGTLSPGGTSSLGSVTTSNINVGGSSSAYLGLSFAFGGSEPERRLPFFSTPQ